MHSEMCRRTFLTSLAAAAVTPIVRAQADNWGGNVIDTHLHLRRNADDCWTHMQGCGVTHAVLLTPANAQDRAKAEMDLHKGRFVRSVSADPTAAGSDKLL